MKTVAHLIYSACQALSIKVVSSILFFLFPSLLFTEVSVYAWTVSHSWEEFSSGQTGSYPDFSPDLGGSVSTAYAHSGTKSYSVAVTAGKENTGQHAYSFPTKITEGQEVWVRVYIFAPQGFDWTTFITKIFRIAINNATGNAAVGYHSVEEIRPADYCGPGTVYGYVVSPSEFIESQPGITTNYLCQNQGTPAAYLDLGIWHALELYVKAGSSGNGISRTWHDGKLIYERTGYSTIPSGGYLGNSSTFVNHLMGWWNLGPHQNQILYFDDLTYTNTTPPQVDSHGNAMIGLTGNADTTPPVAPQNLKVF